MMTPHAINREQTKGWWESLWIWALKRALKQKQNSPVVHRDSQGKKNALVLLDGSDAATWPVADTLISFLKEQGFQVQQLAFFADKKEHSEVKCSYFNLKSMSWKGKPEGEMIEAFEKRYWEVIIGLHRGVCVPIAWLVYQSTFRYAFGPLTDPCVYNIALDGHLEDLQDLPRHVEQLFLTFSSQKHVHT